MILFGNNSSTLFENIVAQLNRFDLLIFDDFGLHDMDSGTRIALLTILNDRYGKKSVIISSQLSLDKWYDYIAEATLADAIMDRLVATSHHISLTRPSLCVRKKLESISSLMVGIQCFSKHQGALRNRAYITLSVPVPQK